MGRPYWRPCPPFPLYHHNIDRRQKIEGIRAQGFCVIYYIDIVLFVFN